MQTQNIQLSEILDTIEEMGDLSESAMEAARARQEILAKPTGALGRLEDISIQLAGITGKVKNRVDKRRSKRSSSCLRITASSAKALPPRRSL